MKPVKVSREALIAGYRSGLEMTTASELEDWGVPFDYEGHPLSYVIPARKARYTPDFILPNGIIVETKGRFVTADRKKHDLIRQQFPELDLRIVFNNPNNRIGKKSQTTYGAWCAQRDIPFAAKSIPREWIKERTTKKRIRALEKALGYIPDIVRR